MPPLRTLLILGRISNLPTIWSNCLAAWWLGGGGNLEKLPFLFGGMTLLYVGGMFLNDAFDAEYDRQHRRARPIPSGAISVKAVWRLGFLWLALGSLALVWLGTATGALAVALVLCILVYDAIHKWITFSPLLMGACRFLVYLIAASTATDGVTGWAVWCGLALMAYVIGLSFLARGESANTIRHHWPLAFLAAPIVLALFMNVNEFRVPSLMLSTALALWIVRSLRPMLMGDHNVGRAVSNLLAGIAFVDLLAITGAPAGLCFAMIALFGAALFGQRIVPAT